MNQKITVFIIGIVVFLVVGVAGFLMIKDSFKGNDEQMDLTQYYSSVMEFENSAELTQDKAVLILQDKIQSVPVTYKNGDVYLSYDIVSDLFNKRFYWDYNEKMLIYALPLDLVEVKPDEDFYTINGEKQEFDRVIVCENDNKVEISLSFVEKYSNIKTRFYENPNRVIIEYIWEKDVLVSTVKNETSLRYEGNSKSEVLKNLSKGEKVTYIMENNADMSKGYICVISDDGIIGFVKEDDLGKSEYEKKTSDYEEPVYTHISKDYDINLTWNMVANETANGMVTDLLDKAPGVNTISPTWFSIADTDGGIHSLASHDYVEAVHARGIEIWALVDDFTPDVSIKEILTHTTSRRNLIKNLMKEVKEYNLDGINVDFEYIKESFSADYIQFIRELSIECRKEKIVLSVDSYVPLYSQFYNRREQGEVADYVVIMAYDEHDSNAVESGSVASISWVKSAIDDTLEQLSDKKKLIIGIPFYDRLWEESVNSDGSTTLVSHRDLTMIDSQNIVSEKGAMLKWDEETKQNYVEYTENGKVFKMWLEDAKSIEEKMKVISQAQIGGVASWRLGQETSDVWEVINTYLN